MPRSNKMKTMTCKECIHCDACAEIFEYVGMHDELLAMNREQTIRPCLHFEDKSRFIELPCNVDDIVYITEDGEIAEHKVVSVDIGYLGFRVYTHCPVQCDIDDPCCVSINICHTSYGQHEFNEKIFFSREEAERAIKERDKIDH